MSRRKKLQIKILPAFSRAFKSRFCQPLVEPSIVSRRKKLQTKILPASTFEVKKASRQEDKAPVAQVKILPCQPSVDVRVRIEVKKRSRQGSRSYKAASLQSTEKASTFEVKKPRQICTASSQGSRSNETASLQRNLQLLWLKKPRYKAPVPMRLPAVQLLKRLYF